jgi:hypothetical protein
MKAFIVTICIIAALMSGFALALASVAYGRPVPKPAPPALAGLCVDGIDPALIGDGWPGQMDKIITWIGQPNQAPNGVLSCPRGDYVSATP